FIDFFNVHVRLNLPELIDGDFESFEFPMDSRFGLLPWFGCFLCHVVYATLTFSVFNAEEILDLTSSVPMISIIIMRSGPPAVPVTANRSACMIFPGLAPSCDATASQVALMADASVNRSLPSASENAEITFTASSFHFFEATFSSYESGGLKKYFPCSHISRGKVIRSCMS